MINPTRGDDWSLGANNVAEPSRIPEKMVRQLVNLDPMVGGTVEKRAGYKKVADGTNVRNGWFVGDYIVYADGAELKAYSVVNNSTAVLATIAPAGMIAGVEANGMLYINTISDSIRTNGVTVKPWAIKEPMFNVELIDGGGMEGQYKVACTALGDDGEESSTSPQIIDVPAGKCLRVTSTDLRMLRVYVSAPNGSTLYFQTNMIAGAVAVTTVRDDTERLTTDALIPMPVCDELVAYHGVLIGRTDKFVFMTMPMWPHLCHPISGWFQYGSSVSALATTDGGVYIIADKTWFLTDPETSKPSQREVLNLGGVAGSAVELPDGRAAWFTRYGQAIGDASGNVTLPNRQNYVPDLAASGAAGVVDSNGNQMIVTTLHGITEPNNLATGDFAELEMDNGE